ncbi:MAG: class I tRNA ligase family protein, partial [Candidatus Aenigmatarchaeota archaeon]
TFWLFNTVVKSWLHFKTIPWTDIAISGYVLDPHGQKMSKSKGNVIDPHGLMEKFGADSVRFWAGSSRLGEDAAYQEKDIVTGQKTINKLWNASRFLSIHIKEKPKKPKTLQAFDQWILAKLSGVIKQSTEHFEAYDFSLTKAATENFFWHDFCDNYLEIIKSRLYEQKDESAKYTLYTVMLGQLKLFAPIIPHVTEELYQKLFKEHEKDVSIHISKWPEPEWTDKTVEKEGDVAVEIISVVRQWKQANKLPLNTELKEVTVEKEKEKMLKPFLNDILAVTKAKKLVFGNAFSVQAGS